MTAMRLLFLVFACLCAASCIAWRSGTGNTVGFAVPLESEPETPRAEEESPCDEDSASGCESDTDVDQGGVE